MMLRHRFIQRTIEMCVGISIACMPALSSMLRHTLPPSETLRSKLRTVSMRSWRRGSTTKQSNSQGTPCDAASRVVLEVHSVPEDPRGNFTRRGDLEMGRIEKGLPNTIRTFKGHGIGTTPKKADASGIWMSYDIERA